jgi:hypothetical protein
MLFKSPHANLRVICRNQIVKRHPVTGDPIETVPELVANFGKMGDVYTYDDPLTGEQRQGARMFGGFFDTDVEAVEQEWDEDTKGLVERTLMRFAQTQQDRIQYVPREKVPAGLPWPTYDVQEPEQVIEYARALGLVSEAVAYEKENLARPLILDALEDVAEAPQPAKKTAKAGPEPETVEEPEAARVGNPKLVTL